MATDATAVAAAAADARVATEGAPPAGAPIRTDVLIVGAGPTGLFAAFELGLLEVGCRIVDVLPEPGGQCAQLYADKPIYDIPGLARTSGAGLVASLLDQLEPLAPPMHLGALVTDVAPSPSGDGRWHVATARGERFDAGALLVCAGAGAFLPKTLPIAGIAELTTPRGPVRHALAPAEGPDGAAADDALAGRRVAIVGDDAACLDALDALDALAPARRPARLVLLHRTGRPKVDAAALARFDAMHAAGRLEVVAGQPVGFDAVTGGGLVGPWLRAVDVAGDDDRTRRVEVDELIVMLGLSPRLGPIADWGLALQRRQLPVDLAGYATALPGVHAAGDIVTYPGKRKLLLSGFHEATLAAFAIAERLRGAPVPLLYTTTSTRLHQLLKVAPTPPQPGA